jgi:16S rRNA C967 or C1407 C5-methylase (RsmB/RsmF family)
MGLPPAFIKHLKEEHGLSIDEIEYFRIPPEYPSIRFNPKKSSFKPQRALPWTDWGMQLSNKPVFHHDPRWHGGLYYVQNKSSMLIEPAFKTWKASGGSTSRTLDLCAAPGGKSTHLASLLDDSDILVSNEVNSKRALVLKDNMERWGYLNTVVINHQPKDIQGKGLFDFIIVDAPCSGEGLFSEYPKAIDQWSESYVKECSLRQKNILDDADRLLSEGGGLLYCTCTVNHQENRMVVEDLVDQKGYEVVEVKSLPAFGARPVYNNKGVLRGYQALPHSIGSRAFFLSLLKKASPQKASLPKARQPFFKKHKEPGSIGEWIDLGADQTLVSSKKGDVFVVREDHVKWLIPFTNLHKVLLMGTPVHNDNAKMPHPGLALSADVTLKMDFHDATGEETLDFLKGHSLPPLGLPGWKVLRFQKISLGFAKSISGRSNNYFPKVWRIPGNTTLDHFKGFQLK